jgi:hypothetical protein
MVDSSLEVGDTGQYLNTNKVTTDAGEVHNEVIDQGNIVSPSVEDAGSTAGNSRDAATLAAGATFQGVGEEVHRYGRAGIAIHSDNATDGTFTIEVSHDGVIWGGPTRSVADTRFANPVMWNIVERYFRVKYVNGTTEATNLSIQVQYSNNADILLGHPLNETLIDEQGAVLTRAVLAGQTQGGTYKNIPVTSDGHLITNMPLTAFGELQVAEKTPQVQVKFPMGIVGDNTQTLTNKAGSTVTSTNGLCTITCPATAEAFSQIRSKDVIRYGPGQGMNARFTASFTAGAALSTQWAGPGDDDEMLGFGMDNATGMSILHRKFGELEVYDLTITQGGDAGGGTFTLTIDDTDVTITVPSGSATIADVCALVVEAAPDIFNAGRGWEVHTDASTTLTFISLVAEVAGGTFAFADVDSGVTATGGFVQTLAGAAPTETTIAQADWNVDVCDGTSSASNPSGMLLDPTKLNVYDINFQYLGAGNLYFGIENSSTGRFAPVHMIQNSGTGTTPTFRNPTFHLNMIAKTEASYAGGALVMTTASMGGFIEGKEAHFGTRREAEATVATNGTTEVVNLVLHNEERFPVTGAAVTRNKVEVYPDHLTIINESTRAIKVQLYVNPTHLDTPPTLAAVDVDNSVMLSAAGSGTIQGGKVLLPIAVSAADSKDIDIEHLGLKLRPTDTWAFVVTKESGGNNGNVTIGLSWLERV